MHPCLLLHVRIDIHKPHYFMLGIQFATSIYIPVYIHQITITFLSLLQNLVHPATLISKCLRYDSDQGTIQAPCTFAVSKPPQRDRLRNRGSPHQPRRAIFAREFPARFACGACGIREPYGIVCMYVCVYVCMYVCFFEACVYLCMCARCI